MRFDLFAANALNISRNKAAELILGGKILLNGAVCDKPSFKASPGDEILLTDEIYVGRGALKLKTFLQNFALEECVRGKEALDVGASTGGFTQILLANGAKSVTCVDVGTNQLDPALKADTRVKFYENTDVREFRGWKFSLITCDVSFISLLEILPALNENAANGALIIALFKPQFEVGREAKRNKKGVVTDAKDVKAARAKFELAASRLGWILEISALCEIKGKEGNAEFFYAFNKR